jgi:hypothetical protein
MGEDKESCIWNKKTDPRCLILRMLPKKPLKFNGLLVS